MRCARVELRDVAIHATVVRPVVCEQDNVLQAYWFRGRDDGVEQRYAEVASVEGRDAVRPELVVWSKRLRGGGVAEALA